MVLDIDIQWKHIVLGFYHEDNPKIHSFNFVIFFVAFRIHKNKMMLRLENKCESEHNILSYLRLDCHKMYLTLKKSKYKFLNNIFLKQISLFL